MSNLKSPEMKIETLAVHAGRRSDPATGAVTPPIHLSTTFERSPDGQYPLGFSYAREGNPNRHSLEECLAALEGGKDALAFSSGLAVATALLQGLELGDHIIAPDDVYYGLRQVIGGVFAKWPLETSYVDMTDVAALRAAVLPNTRLVLIETPSNPLMKIADLAEVARIAREAKAISVCDATFTTPVLQRPLDWGVDMVWHSTTKYIGGHSDVTGGALITRYDNYLFERAWKSLMFGGATPSPFDCWLTLRGLSTLPWRMRAHSENAHAVAEFLQRHPAVERVNYPGCRIIRVMKSREDRCRAGEVCCPSKCAPVAKRRWPSPGACACSHGPPVWAVLIASSSTAHRLKVPARKRHKTCCVPRSV